MKQILAQAAAIALIVTVILLARCSPAEKTYRTPPGTVKVDCGSWPPDRDGDYPCYRILSPIDASGGTK